MKILYGLLCQLLFIHCLFSQEIKHQKEELQFDTLWANVKQWEPLYINGNNIKDDVGANVLYSFVISPFSPANYPTYYFNPATENIHNNRSVAWISNYPIKTMLQILYGSEPSIDPVSGFRLLPAFVPHARVQFRNLDTTGLVFKVDDGEVIMKNRYNVQLTVTGNISKQQLKEQTIKNIEFQFGLKTFWEKQVKDCIVFSRNGLQLSETDSGEAENRMGSVKGKGMVSVNNIPVSEFIRRMLATHKIMMNTDYPIVDELSLKKNLGKIEFQTNDPKLTFENMRDNLARFGIKLSIEKREVDILVITKAAE